MFPKISPYPMRGLLAVACLTAGLSGCTCYRPAPLSILPPQSSNLSETFRTSGTIDADTLARLAVVANPDLKVAAARAGVADAQTFAAGLLPDPAASTGFSSPLSGPDTMLALAGAMGFDIAALRTRSARVAEAVARGRQTRLDLKWAAWQIGAQARLQAARICAFDRIVALDRASVDTTQDRLMHALASAARHDITSDRLGAIRLAALDAANRLRGSERDRLTARYALAALLGLSKPILPTLVAGPTPPSPPDADTLEIGAVHGRPDLAALRAGYDAQEGSLRKAVLDQFPAFSVGIDAGRDSGGAQTIGPAVSFSLPLWNRNRGGIAIARASREAVHAEYDARVAQARNAIGTAVAGIRLAEKQRTAVLTALPDLHALTRTSQAQAQRGDIPQAVAAATTQTERDRERLLAESELMIAEQTIMLEVLTGVSREGWNR